MSEADVKKAAETAKKKAAEAEAATKKASEAEAKKKEAAAAIAATKKAAEKPALKFYFPKNAKKSYRSPTFGIRAENNIYVLLPDNDKYDQIKRFLQEHKENNANGGRVFTELSGKIAEDTDRGALIDKIIDLDIAQLRKVCGGALDLEAIGSKGQLIDLYLKQQEGDQDG
jgi:hypothetical protein